MVSCFPSSPKICRSGLWWKIHWIETSGYWSMPPFSLRNLLTRGSRFSRQALHETTLPFLKALAPSASSETSARAARMRCGSGRFGGGTVRVHEGVSCV